MTGAGIFDGDLLVVDEGIDAAPSSVVIGLINQEPVCKRLDYERGVPVLKLKVAGHPDRFVMERDLFAAWGGSLRAALLIRAIRGAWTYIRSHDIVYLELVSALEWGKFGTGYYENPTSKKRVSRWPTKTI